MMLRAFNLVLAVGLCSFPAAVVAAEPDAVTTALLRASVEQKVSTPSERQALVQAAANYCDTLRRVYPRNSPSEDVWLKEEVAAGGDRPWRALRSAEFGRRMAANFVDACVYSAKAYQAGKDKHNSLLWLA